MWEPPALGPSSAHQCRAAPGSPAQPQCCWCHGVQPEGWEAEGSALCLAMVRQEWLSSVRCVCCWVLVLWGFGVLIAAVPADLKCFWVSAQSCSLQETDGSVFCTFAALGAEQWQFWSCKPNIRTKAFFFFSSVVT